METPRITFRADNKLIEKMKAHPDFINITEFIIEAIQDKLGNKNSLSKNLADMVKDVKSLDTKTTERKVIDLEIGNQLIYEELKKQNEILKIIHSRASLAASFSRLSTSELKKDEDFVDAKEDKWYQLISEELDKIQLTIRRK